MFRRSDGRSSAAPFPWVTTAAPIQPVNRATAFDGTGLGGEGRLWDGAQNMSGESAFEPARPVGSEAVADNGGGGSGFWEGR